MAALVSVTALAIAREFLPELVGRLVGPRREEVARAIVEATAKIVGREAVARPAPELVVEIAEDPGRAEALRFELKAIEFQEYEAEVEDRKSARAYALSLTPTERSRGTWLLATNVALLVFAVSALVALHIMELTTEAVVTLLVALATMFATNFKDAFAFEFGSSRGSMEKSEDLRRAQVALVAEAAERRRPEISETAPVEAAEPESAAMAASSEPAPRPRNFVAEILEMEM